MKWNGSEEFVQGCLPYAVFVLTGLRLKCNAQSNFVRFAELGICILCDCLAIERTHS